MSIFLLFSFVQPDPIGYSTAGDAQSCSVPIAKLLYRGNAIEASSTRIEYSIMELGALFGNNGEGQREVRLFSPPPKKNWVVPSYWHHPKRSAHHVIWVPNFLPPNTNETLALEPGVPKYVTAENRNRS